MMFRYLSALVALPLLFLSTSCGLNEGENNPAARAGSDRDYAQPMPEQAIPGEIGALWAQIPADQTHAHQLLIFPGETTVIRASVLLPSGSPEIGRSIVFIRLRGGEDSRLPQINLADPFFLDLFEEPGVWREVRGHGQRAYFRNIEVCCSSVEAARAIGDSAAVFCAPSMPTCMVIAEYPGHPGLQTYFNVDPGRVDLVAASVSNLADKLAVWGLIRSAREQ